MYNITLWHVHESLLPWKSNKYYLLVCARMWVPWRMSECVPIVACSLANSAHNMYAPQCDAILVSTKYFVIIS
jgi:hypothetical protein